jgi:hypothetical protein
MKTFLLLVVGLTALAAAQTGAGFPQAAQSAGAPSPAEFDALLTRVVNAAKEYGKTFRNLVAEETKVDQVLEQSGTV